MLQTASVHTTSAPLFIVIAGCAAGPPAIMASAPRTGAAAVRPSVAIVLVVRDDTDAKGRLQKQLAALLPRAGVIVAERANPRSWTLAIVVVNRARVDEAVHETVRTTRPRAGFGFVGGGDDLPTGTNGDWPTDGERVDVAHDTMRSTLQLEAAATLMAPASTRPPRQWTTTMRTPIDLSRAGGAWDAVYRFAAERIAQETAHVVRQAAR